MTFLKKIVGSLLVVIFFSTALADEFIIHKIIFVGLNHISPATALHNLPVREGDRINSKQTTQVIRELYKKSFFSDIKIERKNNNLIIAVVERPVISSIKVSGNSKITTKQIDEVLKGSGLTNGQILDQAMFDVMIQGLKQQYNIMAMYDVKINTSTIAQKNNCVLVDVKIKEGPVAKIKAIKIIGNKAFSEKTLLSQMALSTTKPWSFFTDADKYNKEKLDFDLEKIHFYYLDHGYLNFKIKDTKTTITSDKKYIYITVSMDEGALYKIEGFEVAGDLLGHRAEIIKLITLKAGQIFSRQEAMISKENIIKFMGNYGYGMPDIQIEPIVNDVKRIVFVKFNVNPGQRIYIHNIIFEGNTKTHDEVLRREMRLQEGSVFSLSKIKESSRKLSNLGYLDNVDYKITPVPERPGQVDLTYNVKETSSTSVNVQGGVSSTDGFLCGAGLTDTNIFGSGKTTSVRFDKSRSFQLYNLGYYDPYFTVNNIGFSANAYFNKTDTSKLTGRSAYGIDTIGGLASFILPLSDYDTLTFGAGLENIKIKAENSSKRMVRDFIKRYGSSFTELKLIIDWNYTTFDRAIFPTDGFSQDLNLTTYEPLNKHGLSLYTITHRTSWYQPLFKGFILHTNTGIGYGNSIGGRPDQLPFFKNFSAGGLGGLGQVRGFVSGDIGCQDEDNYATGGNVLTAASVSVIIPAPMKNIVRPSIFFDIGDVYKNKFKPGELRASCGIQLEIHTPFVPIILSLGKAVRKQNNDSLKTFDFSISTSI